MPCIIHLILFLYLHNTLKGCFLVDFNGLSKCISCMERGRTIVQAIFKVVSLLPVAFLFHFISEVTPHLYNCFSYFWINSKPWNSAKKVAFLHGICSIYICNTIIDLNWCHPQLLVVEKQDKELCKIKLASLDN